MKPPSHSFLPFSSPLSLSLLSLSPFQSYVKLSGLSVVAAEASEEGSRGPRLWEEDEGTVSLSAVCGGLVRSFGGGGGGAGWG